MLSAGQSIGPYELLRKLGGGAFGEVWLVRHLWLDAQRAMKIPTDPDYVAQLRKEGIIQFKLDHPNIVRTIELDPLHNPPYFVMEYVEGRDLRKVLNERGRLPPAEALGILGQILDALTAAHATGVLHRDLKPENILLTPDGTVKVADFGLGRVQEEVTRSLLLSGSMMSKEGKSVSGTIEYMSPEARSGNPPDPRDDLYAAGILGCELLTGSRPLPGISTEDQFEEARVHADHAKVFQRALALPRRRYATAAEMRSAVQGAKAGEEARTEAERRRIAEEARRREEEARRAEAERLRRKQEEERRREEGARARVEEADRQLREAELQRQREEQARARARGKSIAIGVGLAAAALLLIIVLAAVGSKEEVPAPKGYPAKAAPKTSYQTKGAVTPSPAASAAEQARIREAVARGDPEITNSIGMRLRRIEAGSFQMGSNDNDSEKPVHPVTLSKPFYLGAHEVTQEQYERVMGSNPSYFKGARLPVETVSWHDAKGFCQRLSQMEGITYRLPTEAEWEYACRAGSSTVYSFGDADASLGEYAWYSQNSGNQTHDVGQKRANAWGLYDMHGNVWEWCEDWYGPYQGGSQADPGGPPSGEYRVLRGGSWYINPRYLRSANRNWDHPEHRYIINGFRVVLPAAGPL